MTNRHEEQPASDGLVGLRILVVMTSLDNGGAERVALDFALDWQDRGAVVQVVTLLDVARPMERSADLPHKCLAFRASAKPSLADRLWANLGVILRLRRELALFKPDLIVSHVDRTNVVTLLAALWTGRPVTVVEHNHYGHHPIGRMWNFLRACTYPLAARIVAVSTGVAKSLPRPLRSKTVVIHNPIRPLKKVVVRQPLTEIMAMGRLTRQKGFDLLIRAFAIVFSRVPDARLTIWGEGEERTSLEDLRDGLGLRDVVSLPGKTADPEGAFLRAGSFVLASRYEGFGLTLAEAMSVGLPVVSADCESGPAEIIRDGIDGILVPAGSHDAISDGLLKLITNPELASELAARATEIDARFAFSKQASLWLDVLLSLSRKASARVGSSYRPQK